MATDCPFCAKYGKDLLYQDEQCIVIRDGYPISPGHTLVIPKRHIGSFFYTTDSERASLLRALDWAKGQLDQEYTPAAYNIGINDGSAAGQTVPHMHIHLIPRFEGDCEDPRGGIRWIIPDHAKYWKV